jgi:ubiquinone/menaquinone biosynthesis C-methylase UbiE/DNA-binding HxlR family transcriptional regulator
MLLNALKAVAEATRLTIVAILDRGDLSVNDLAHVLGQSQPRVSRHLRLLVEAGVLERHQEGAHTLYGLAHTGIGASLVRQVLPLMDDESAEVGNALARLARLQAQRNREAAAYFERLATHWDVFRDRMVGESVVEARIVELLDARTTRDLLDLGTGTGRMLEVTAPYTQHGLGIDLSAEMLRIARAKLQGIGLNHCHVRKGDVNALNLPAGSADVAILHHVLQYLDHPSNAVAEAARTLRPGGQLIVVDFAPHTATILCTQYAHRRMGFSHQEMRKWLEGVGLEDVQVENLQGSASVVDDGLTISVWCATQQQDAPSHHHLEVA